jgi:hypothetical protein
MDIGFDHNSWRSAPAPMRLGGTAGAPEWLELRTRLSTVRAARCALARQEIAGSTVSAGSFDRASAQALADYDNSLAAVNVTFWADGKPHRIMDSIAAGEISPGDRG